MAGDAVRGAMASFRQHRHDLLNELQILRAYLQLGRLDHALKTVDDIAAWLRSLSQWQTAFPGCDALVWCASQCPHVRLSALIGDPASLGANQVKALCRAWEWLEESAKQAGVRLAVDVAAETAGNVRLVIKRSEESERWWQTVGEPGRGWQTLDVNIELGL